jgi:HTH-type transcriptional regulator / antitoxin HigA
MLNIARIGGKMTLTFNRDTYADLLVQYQPKVITNDQENEYAIAIIEELSHRQSLTLEEETLVELLVALVETFEAWWCRKLAKPFQGKKSQ